MMSSLDELERNLSFWIRWCHGVITTVNPIGLELLF